MIRPLPDFHAVALEKETQHGTYYVERVAADWAVRFRAKGSRPDTRDVPIDARVDGELADWPTRGCAEEACRLHAQLLDLGYSVSRATQLVASRSERVSRHQRVETLDYAEPVAVRR